MLVLGSACTLAVTWIVALRCESPPASTAAPTFSHEFGAAWYVRSEESFWRTRVEATAMSEWAAAGMRAGELDPMPRWSATRQPPSGEQLQQRITEHAFGWPARCMRYHLVYPLAGGARGRPPTLVDAADWPQWAVRFGAPQPGTRRADNMRPTRLDASGFSVNSIAYAMALALVWLAVLGSVRGVRHIRRIARGRCPRCAYDLRGALTAGCPECGWRRESTDT